MKLELKIYSALCETEIFTVNGINATYEDFGEKYDHDTENAEDYGCGDMQFDMNPPTEEVLEKYKITLNEYYQICEKLSEGLHFGECGWCV